MALVKRVYARGKKKRKVASLSQIRDPVFTVKRIQHFANEILDTLKQRTKAINIIGVYNNALGISVPFVLHWMLTALTLVFFVLSCVCKGVVTSNLFLFRYDLSGRKATPKSTLSIQQHVIVKIYVAYLVVFILSMLPCTAANHEKSNTGCGGINTGIALATTAAVAVVYKMNVQRSGSNKLNTCPSFNFSMNSKEAAARAPTSPPASNKRKHEGQPIVSPYPPVKTSDEAQHDIDWADVDEISEMHKLGRLRDLKLDDVKKADIMSSITKFSKENLIIMYINLSNKISSVRPDPNKLKSKHAVVNGFAELILSNIGGVQRADA